MSVIIPLTSSPISCFTFSAYQLESNTYRRHEEFPNHRALNNPFAQIQLQVNPTAIEQCSEYLGMSFNLSSAIKLLASSNCPERDRRATSQARCNRRCLDADEVKLPFLNHVCSNASMKDSGFKTVMEASPLHIGMNHFCPGNDIFRKLLELLRHNRGPCTFSRVFCSPHIILQPTFLANPVDFCAINQRSQHATGTSHRRNRHRTYLSSRLHHSLKHMNRLAGLNYLPRCTTLPA
ncbi:hypothetical protein C1H46_036260 [Malus baccata]|uniref:Uncharacterized protein n=1 Tax=Malus baccata TaxID=106549 RepID=A0A540KVE2_MALBA|nr:hypothetical protein C1H46_036260 [Malus baccata]